MPVLGLNSDLQSWWQVPLPVELHNWPPEILLNKTLEKLIRKLISTAYNIKQVKTSMSDSLKKRAPSLKDTVVGDQ